MEALPAKDLKLGQEFDLGIISFSEDEIISFAKANDPLPFHTDKKIAEQSIFKGLVASGPHAFNIFYNRTWVPRFGDTVICGLGVNNWRFIKPVYANQPIHGKLTITELKPNPEKGHVVIKWKFDFFDSKGEMVQTLDITVLHKL